MAIFSKNRIKEIIMRKLFPGFSSWGIIKVCNHHPFEASGGLERENLAAKGFYDFINFWINFSHFFDHIQYYTTVV